LDLGPARSIKADSLGAYELSRFLRDQDLLWNSTGTGTIGRVSRVQNPPANLICDSHVTVVRCSRLVSEYVRIWLRSDHVFGRIEGDASGSTNQVELTLQMALAMPVPLPPLAEQDRIVAKLDELMALCDELEAAQTHREARRDLLRATSLRNLVAPEEPKENARFFLRHSARMITRPEHVAGVRQAIWDLAVRGRLVPQDAGDEPTSELLRACDDARVKVAVRDRRADVARQAMLATDLRWAVPHTWDWRGLADLVLFIDYRGKTPVKVDSGVRLVTAKNVRRGYLSLEPQEFIARAEYDRWMTRGLPAEGDVLFTTEAPMGNAAVVRLTEPFALAQRVINFRPLGATMPEFLALQIAARPFQQILARTATGLTALGIKAAKLKRLPVAIPPLAEQHRIVAKVDELMALCNELEQSLAAEQTKRARLLEALLHDALEDALPARELELLGAR
jgi:type I restriction enzyme S subunit